MNVAAGWPSHCTIRIISFIADGVTRRANSRELMVRAAKCVRQLAPGQAALAAALVEGSVDGREIPSQSTILGGGRKGDVTSVSGLDLTGSVRAHVPATAK